VEFYERNRKREKPGFARGGDDKRSHVEQEGKVYQKRYEKKKGILCVYSPLKREEKGGPSKPTSTCKLMGCASKGTKH